MPWWGWLIAFGIAAACFTVITITVIMTRTMRSAMNDMDRPLRTDTRIDRGIGRRGPR
jgi:hypothetical protein